MSEDKDSTAIHEYGKQDGTAAILFFYITTQQDGCSQKQNTVKR